jgi:DinB family protein
MSLVFLPLRYFTLGDPRLNDTPLPEPWLRGTLHEVSSIPRAVLHALELAKEDLFRCCGELTDDEVNFRYAGIAPVAFHVRHIARSLDRLLTYAEGRTLDATQITALKGEADDGAARDEVFAELDASLRRAVVLIRSIDPNRLSEPRAVGTKALPITLGGLLVHIAEHTQRHVGQAVTTAKFVRAVCGGKTSVSAD